MRCAVAITCFVCIDVQYVGLCELPRDRSECVFVGSDNQPYSELRVCKYFDAVVVVALIVRNRHV